MSKPKSTNPVNKNQPLYLPPNLIAWLETERNPAESWQNAARRKLLKLMGLGQHSGTVKEMLENK